MKKLFLAILTFIYMGVSSGIAMDVHYCMGKVLKVDLYAKDNGKCDKCKINEKKSCCGEKHKFYKLSNAHQNVNNNLSFSPVLTAIVIPYHLYSMQYVAAISCKAVANNSPPIYAGPSACILNCTFRI
jgi:hypothetical protein